jgi:hypothetical protein
MTEQSEIVRLLEEIRDHQKLSLQRQDEHLAIAKEQTERSRKQVEESVALQREAIARFKNITRIVLPVLLLCIALILYLLIRYF